MRRSTILTTVTAGAATSILLTIAPPRAWAHCEIPCGIYGDHARIVQMQEDATTIAKAVDQIRALSGGHDSQSQQQLVRWTMNKEEHATRIQDTIAQYFLNQRIKPAGQGSKGWNDYVMKLVEHHAVMVAAMKTKQSVDPAAVENLRAAIDAIAVYYPADHAHATTAPTRRR